ncbi:hypothetical protein GCM10012320_07490 [Sinomonas cellulolyticus]|uniref:Small integral membrane protein n=1 Tax=Sinomonas cellulolyticus TaxID=2801916 RepID=A0ABS1K3H9_9MICC|nr:MULTISPECIES: hypothetical protein [Sinomonas]MBL0706074.1 hypothetical protein [Sinomonas cellulolyticus]GHG43354.1 hypothetical protein GCM10012320_07490 [Sinomonas sp. KCTC 49339]
MNPVVVGIAVGAFLAFMSFQFGVWGFLGSLIFMAVGAVLGRAVQGQIDLRRVWEALLGRRSSS